MSQHDIKKALVTALEALNLGITLRYPNEALAASTDSPHGDVTHIFNIPDVHTLGDGGEDLHTGIFQVLLKYPLGKGDEALMQKASQIREGFSAGSRKTFSTQEVVIQNCGMGKFDVHDGSFVCPISIYWYAKTRRS